MLLAAKKGVSKLKHFELKKIGLRWVLVAGLWK